MDRVPDFESEGCRFDPCWAHSATKRDRTHLGGKRTLTTTPVAHLPPNENSSSPLVVCGLHWPQYDSSYPVSQAPLIHFGIRLGATMLRCHLPSARTCTPFRLPVSWLHAAIAHSYPIRCATAERPGYPTQKPLALVDLSVRDWGFHCNAGRYQACAPGGVQWGFLLLARLAYG